MTKDNYSEVTPEVIVRRDKRQKEERVEIVGGFPTVEEHGRRLKIKYQFKMIKPRLCAWFITSQTRKFKRIQ